MLHVVTSASSYLVPAARCGTAFGWYNLAIGLGALPASLLFGFVWDRAGARGAFAISATLALMAAAAIAFVSPGGAPRLRTGA